MHADIITVLVDGFIFGANPHGGIARYFREMMIRVVSVDPTVRFLLLCDERALPHLPEHRGIQIFCFRPWRHRPSRVFSRLNAWRRRLFDQRLQAMRPLVFHSTYYTPAPFLGMRTAATVYDLVDWQLPFLQPNGPGFVARQRRCLAEADHIISISSSTMEQAVAAFGLERGKFTVAHLDASPDFHPASPADQEGFRARYTRGMPFFLFVGSLASYKNLAVLVRAMAAVRDRTNAMLVVAGHGKEALGDSLVDLAVQGRVEERIVRLVHPSDDELRLAYAASSAFVYPSLAEGFGIPLIEAMRCETPVIASDIPVFREVCGDAALYFDPHSADALASCLFKVLVDLPRGALLERSRSRSGQFSWDRAAALHAAIYRSLAKT